jgi:zinc D-Ala-D-Ala carboxypeptidase
MYKYFKDSEIQGLNPELVSMLDKAREIAKIPFIITSGVRTLEECIRLDGITNSSHITGNAVDLRCRTSEDRFKILNALLKAGFTRIGLKYNHIHADIDKTKIQCVLWLEA